MPNKFYAPGPDRSPQVRNLFTQIAPRYDLINDLQSLGLHRFWKQKLLHYLPSHPQPRILDLCCGTGDLAFSALRRTAGSTVAADFTLAMLQHARKRALQTPPTLQARCHWIQADALHLPFQDQSFDAVLVGYGLRNLASLTRGLQETERVLKPGGRLISLDFSKPPLPAWRLAYFAYLRLVVPCYGLLFCGNPSAYSYILRSLQDFPAAPELAEAMKQAGFPVARYQLILGGAMAIHYAEKPAANTPLQPAAQPQTQTGGSSS